MKTLDITDKLKFEESPVIIIKGEKLTVNDDAMTMLSLMELLGNGASTEDATQASKLLFSEEDFEKLAKLKLNFADFSTVINSAIDLITGGEESEGE